MNEPNRQNGYKDPEQSVIDFALIEMGADFEQVADPARGALWLARDYRKTYTAARNSSIVAAALGGLTVAGALAISLPVSSPLVLCGLAATGLGGIFIRHHASGAANSEAECKFLEQYPELPKALAHAVGQGLSRELAVAVYQKWLSIVSTGRTLTAGDIQRTFAEATNAAIEGYKLGQQSATAFSTGELVNLPDYSTTVVEDESEDEPTAPTEPDTRLNVPAFLRDTVPAPKTEGVAIQTARSTGAIAAPVRLELLERIISINGFLPSRLFVGGSRTGKSQLASDAGAKARQLYPEATIFYLSAGYTEVEDSDYWRFANHVAGYSFKDMKPEQIRGAYEHWMKLLDEFDRCVYSREKPKLLIVDELNTVMTFGQNSNSGKLFTEQLKGRLQLAASVGAKDGYCLWGIAPVGDMGSLCLSRGQTSAFNPVYVGIFGSAWNQTTYTTAVGNGLAPKIPPSGFREGDRIVGIGGEWELLPESKRLAANGQDHRIFPESTMDFVMEAIAAQTMAQISETESVDLLTQQMRSVYDWARRKGLPFDKRGVQQATLTSLKGLSADEIGTLLEMMLEDGYLSKQGDFYCVNFGESP